MVDLNQEQTVSPTGTDMSAKKKELLSTAMKRTSEWIFSQEIPSDVTVHVGAASFSLHKFPLVSKCGYIRKMVSKSSDINLSTIDLPHIPGGAEAFELAAKFCYGINFEISTENIATLRCVAEHLEMTEDYAVGNLVVRTEAYLNEVALKSLAGAISILHSSENLFPTAEETKLVSRCIDAIAYITCRDSQFCTLNRAESGNEQLKPVVDWWADNLTVLRIDIFHRVLIAMMARGFKQYALGPILMLYAQKSLRGLVRSNPDLTTCFQFNYMGDMCIIHWQEKFGTGRKKIEPRQEHEKRVVLETIVSLLPREKNAMSVSFLSMLLRAAIYLETTIACRLDLEKRMGRQLGQAVLDDLLIPLFTFTGDMFFDVDTVQRIMMNFLEYDMEGNRLGYVADEDFVSLSPPLSDMEKVGKLMENYIAEIASDQNLTVSRFISLAELIPEQSRVTEDGIYRAIDIYLKAHPALSDMERKKVCSLMDCQKLSLEACAHAAQNDRLPVQTVVQVLFYEQQRLREAMDSGSLTSGLESPALPPKLNLYTTGHIRPVPNDLSSLKRENQELKFELVRMKMKLKEMGKPTDSPSLSDLSASDKPSAPRKSFIGTVSRKLGRLYPFLRGDGFSTPKGQTKPSRDRRHSIS